MTKKSRNSDVGFIMQGSILAIASIISRIVGLIYRIPLTATIGKAGNDYYGTAYEVYNIILLISSYSIPLAVSKLVSARVAKGHVKDAYNVLRGALIFAVISGTTATLIVYFFADFFTGVLLKTPLAAIALKVLAPTLLIVAVLGVFRGFFQGLGTMIPSAISQIAEQIVNAIVSIITAINLVKYGRTIGAVLANEEQYAAAFGAAGGTLGTAVGALFGLLFLLFIYYVFRKVFIKKVKKDRHKKTETMKEIMPLLVMTIIPVLLSTTVYNISSIIDNGIFKNITHIQGYSTKAVSEMWGVFTGQYKVLINVPISIASALAASCVPTLTKAYHSQDMDLARKQIGIATRFIMIIAIPCAVGMAVLSKPIMFILFSDHEFMSYFMMSLGSISIVFYSLSTLSNGMLQGIDLLRIPVRNAVMALIAHVAVLIVLLEVFKLNIYAVVIANIFYAFCMCLLNEIALRKNSGAKIDVKYTFIIPSISALIMGIAVALVYFPVNIFLYPYMQPKLASSIAALLSIIIGVIVYFSTMIKFKGLDEESILKFPKGAKIVQVAKLLHLLK